MNESPKLPKSRSLKQQDHIGTCQSVDLSITLYTLGVPFFDPANPYFYKIENGKPFINFGFEMRGTEPGLDFKPIVKEWRTVEAVGPELTPVSVSKRTIWERRHILRALNDRKHKVGSSPLPSGVVAVGDVRLASIAHAIGWPHASPLITEQNGERQVCLVIQAPQHLHASGIKTLDDLQEALAKETKLLRETKRPNDLHIVALATYINLTGWIKHFKEDAKPRRHFKLSTGHSLWVTEGSTRYKELIAEGVKPQP
jgi:hypothetical protein